MMLKKITADKRIRLEKQKALVPFCAIRREAELANRKEGLFDQALQKKGISIIGEFKNASPSLGKIKSKITMKERMEAYQASVDAISCLTEEDHFLGSINDLKKIRTMTELPILRKDFMIDEYQFYEAKAVGADAVLLIAAILDDVQMRDFYGLTKALHMDALVEVHDEWELERALLADVSVIGINNRDLNDFTIRLETTKRLSSMVPQGKRIVSESGVREDAHIRYLKECGADACLVGRALMEAEDPKELVKRWKHYERNQR